MSLATRCPDCKTLCPTTAAQLQSQNGHMTCGHCGCLFSGIDHLTPADEDSWMTGSDPNSPNDPTSQTESIDPAAHATTKPGRWGARLFQRFQSWPRFARRWGLVLSLLLVWQLIWWQRVALANAVPVLATPLATISQWLGADLARPASVSVKILASSLKSVSDNRLALEVRIRNDAASPSRWPVLELALTDSKRDTVSAIALGHADYAVNSTEPPNRTLRPGEDVELIAYIDTHTLNQQTLDLPVSGYKLSIADTLPKPVGASVSTRNPH